MADDKQSINLDLLHLPVPELVQMAERALQERDAAALDQADQALHFHFLEQLRKRKQAERKPFLGALLELADGRGVRELSMEGAAKAAVRWEYLFQILESLDVPESREAEARQFVDSREYGWELLQIVAEAEESGESLTQTALGEKLRRGKSAISQMLSKLEDRGLIERHQEGQNVFIGLGMLGVLLMEKKAPMVLPEKKLENDYRNVSETLVGLMSN